MATILTKKSDTASAVPLAADLTNAAGGAELAVNATDKRLFSKTSGGTVVELGTNPSTLVLPSGSANGVAYLNGSKVVTSGSALTFDGTNLALTTTGAIYKVPTAGGSLFDAGGNNGIYILGSSNYVATYVAGSEQMRLTSTGLGIGTSSPTEKLEVVGNYIKVTGTTNQVALRASNTGGDAYFGIDNSAGSNFNTGTAYAGVVWRSGANPICFVNNSSEKMRLDTSGNLGLGVTPSAWAWPNGSAGALQLQSGAAVSGYNATTYLSQNWYYNAGEKYIANGFATRYEQTTGKHAWYTAASGTAGNAVSWTQAMTLDASGNLGIGTTSPSSFLATQRTLVIGSGSGDVGQTIYTGSSSQGTIAFADGLTGDQQYRGYIAYIHSSDALTFGSAGAERARIDSSGNLLVGTTSSSGAKFVVDGDFSGSFGGRVNTTATTGYMQQFQTQGTERGYIYSSSSGTTYNTVSDYRLKNNIAPMTGALAKVAQLKPCTYKWNADGSDGEGFIAHELAEVVPQCVTGEKDAVDEDGNPKYQGIDTSFLVATLTAALQELNAKFDAYVASHP